MKGNTEHQTEKIVLVVSSLIFLFIMIGNYLKLDVLRHIDQTTLRWFIQMFGEPKMQFGHVFLNNYMTALATYGDVLTFVVMSIVIAIILLFKRYYVLSLWLLATVASGGILGIIFKDIIHRHRPYDHLLADTGFSFPSGHSLSSTLIVIIIFAVFLPKVKHRAIQVLIAGLLSVLWVSILFSRMYFHAHFLTDVIGGVSLGIVWVMAAILIYRSLFMKLPQINLLRKGKIYYIK